MFNGCFASDVVELASTSFACTIFVAQSPHEREAPPMGREKSIYSKFLFSPHSRIIIEALENSVSQPTWQNILERYILEINKPGCRGYFLDCV